MHPNLAPHLHEKQCVNFIESLSRCHAENPWKKFTGVCNDIERSLQKCLNEEVKRKRLDNRERAKEQKKRNKNIKVDY